MRTVRSIVAIASAVAVIGCQTAASVAGTSRPVPVSAASAVQASVASASEPAVVSSRPVTAAAENGRSRGKTVLIVLGVALLVIGGVLLFSGGSSSY